MGVRTLRVLPFWGLGLVLAPLVAVTLLLTAPVHRPAAPPAFAVAVEPSPELLAPAPALLSAVLPDAPPVLTPVLLTRDIQIYRGQEFRFVKTLSLRVTAYAPDPRCTYPYDGKTTASGLPVTTNGGHLVAADTAVIPLHWLVTVPGYAGNRAVPVLDRGGAIKGARLDVLLPTFEQAKSWGVRTLKVRVYRPAASDH
jgi:3D (Asp-Asp-Asp) domain-containing protein